MNISGAIGWLLLYLVMAELNNDTSGILERVRNDRGTAPENGKTEGNPKLLNDHQWKINMNG